MNVTFKSSGSGIITARYPYRTSAAVYYVLPPGGAAWWPSHNVSGEKQYIYEGKTDV